MQMTRMLPALFLFRIPLPNIPLPMLSFCNCPDQHSPDYA